MNWRSVAIQNKPSTVAVACLFVFALFLAACASATPDKDTLSNIQAQSTLEVLKATSQAIEVNLTNTAYVPTLQARQSATAQAWLFTSWTATASVVQTATAVSGTATGQSVHATGTQQKLDITATLEVAAANAQATALHSQAVSVELAVERERLMNTLWAITPWAMLVLVLVVSLVVVLRRSRVRPIFRDPHGDAPILIVDGKIVYDADRNPQPLLDLSGKKPAIPALTDLVLQAATTMRDQMIDLVSRSSLFSQPAHRQEIAQKMIGQDMSQAIPEISVLSPDESRPLLQDVLPGIVRDTVSVDILDEDEKGGMP